MATVKTAISIPEAMFREVDDLARDRGVPRSRLLVLALEEYLAAVREADLQAKFNAAWAEPLNEEELAEMKDLQAISFASLDDDDEW